MAKAIDRGNREKEKVFGLIREAVKCLENGEPLTREIEPIPKPIEFSLSIAAHD